MSRGWLPSAAAALALLGGCAPQDWAYDAGARDGALAKVRITFTHDAQGTRYVAQGHFARFAAGHERRAATLLGLAEEDNIPLDSCVLVDAAEELDRAYSAAGNIDVALLDAGRLLVKGPSDAAELSRRRYPELTPEVAGVVYSAENAGALTLEPGALYDVVGVGGEEVGPFTASLLAPRAFPSLEVAPLRRGSDLELHWSEAGEVSDPLLITVAWTSRAGAREVRCRVRDDGSFAVPRQLFASFPSAAQVDHAEVAALRLRRTSFLATGSGAGEISIGLRDSAPLVSIEEP